MEFSDIKTYVYSNSQSFFDEIKQILENVFVSVDGWLASISELTFLIESGNESIVISDSSFSLAKEIETEKKYEHIRFIFVCDNPESDDSRSSEKAVYLNRDFSMRDFYTAYFPSFFRSESLSSKKITPEGAVLRNEHSYVVNVCISDLLYKIGMPSNIKGSRYLRSAILKATLDPFLLEQITKNLYFQLAEDYDSSAINVERAIRNAIDITWKTGDSELQRQYFGECLRSNRNRPSNVRFIISAVNIIRTRFGLL